MSWAHGTRGWNCWAGSPRGACHPSPAPPDPSIKLGLSKHLLAFSLLARQDACRLPFCLRDSLSWANEGTFLATVKGGHCMEITPSCSRSRTRGSLQNSASMQASLVGGRCCSARARTRGVSPAWPPFQHPGSRPPRASAAALGEEPLPHAWSIIVRCFAARDMH